jgi:hypothetical protein
MRFRPGRLALILAVGLSAAAAPIATFSGIFESADELGTGTFTLAGTSQVWIQTWSYGGGTAADGAVVAGGNFDPMITLFAGDVTGPNAGSALMVDWNDDGVCPPGNSGARGCLDSTLGYFTAGQAALILSAGQYSVVVSMFPNMFKGSRGGTFDQGFSGGAVFDEEEGRAWFVEVQGVAIPEPGTMLLTGGALALLGRLLGGRRGKGAS